MKCHRCNRVTKHTYLFDNDRSLGLYFPDQETATKFDIRVNKLAGQILDGKIEQGDAVRDLERFVSNTGVDVEGHEDLPLTSTLLLLEATMQTVSKNRGKY